MRRGRLSHRLLRLALLAAVTTHGMGEVAAASGAAADVSAIGAVSFNRSRHLALVDGRSGELVDDITATQATRDLAASGDGQLFIVGGSMIERIELAAPTQRQRLKLYQADRVVGSASGAHAYVSRAGPNVSAVTLGTPASIAWIVPMPGRVHTLAADPTGHLLFAGYGGRAARIAIINTESARIERTWSIPREPSAMAMSHDGSALYTLDATRRTLSALQTADGATRASLRIGKYPRALAIAPDDKRLYLVDPLRKTLIVVDAAGLTVEQTVVLPVRPYDIAVTPDGAHVMVTSPRARALLMIDTASLQVVRRYQFGRLPWRIVFPAPAATSPAPTPTAPVPSPSATPDAVDTPTVAATATPTVTATTQPTPLPPSWTPTAAIAPTNTPVPPGLISGEVYEDTSAQPLSGVEVAVRGGAPVATDAAGHYAFEANAGKSLLDFSKSGYTRAFRVVEAAARQAAQPLDARLTPLVPATVVGSAGGHVEVALGSLSAEPGQTLALDIPPRMLEDGTPTQLTPVSPQGLIAPVPHGWSVLLAVALAPALSHTPQTSEPTRLHLPLAVLGGRASIPAVTALWDDTAAVWRCGPPPIATNDALRIELQPPGFWGSELALIVADANPFPPPVPVLGEPINGVIAVLPADESGLVVTEPATIVAGSNQNSRVVMQVADVSDRLPSGTVVEARLREVYDLRDGRQIEGTVANEDVIMYRFASTLGFNSAPSGLAASFDLIPSRGFSIAELRSGRVTIALVTPESAPPAEFVDSRGGEIAAAGGVRLIVPPQAVHQATAMKLTEPGPAALPADVVGRADLIATFRLEVSGGVLDPAASYGLSLENPAADGTQFAIARVAIVDGRPAMVFSARGHERNGLMMLEACFSAISMCLPGLAGGGTYAVFALPAGTSMVTGTVSDENGPRAGLTVQANTTPLTSVTDTAGRYLLPIASGSSSVLTSSERERDLRASVAVTPNEPGQFVSANLQLLPAAPRVVQIDPANHASQVPVGAAITVTFSEPIAAASITPQNVQLSAVGTQRAVGETNIPLRRSLSGDGTQLLLTPATPLAANTIYRVALSDDVRDRGGNSLTGAPTNAAFVSDFTTAPTFRAETLPPNTLRMSLPDAERRVFVCGGAQLAAAGTAVMVTNVTSGVTATGLATDAAGVSGSDLCDYRFPGRCDTGTPGSFCVVVDAAAGDRVDVQVEDVLHNTVTLDAGNMRDERTGATAIGVQGGRVSAVEDPRYTADIPSGAFDAVQIVTLFPIRDQEFPVQLDDTAGLHRLGALFLDFRDENVTAAKELRLAIPAPPDSDPAAQVLVGHVVNFRGAPELTMVETASFSADADGQGVLATNSPPFPGVTHAGHYDFSTPDRSVGYVMGTVDKHHSTIEVLPSALTFVFPFLDPVLTKFVMPVPANTAFTVTLTDGVGAQLDAVAIQGPPAGEIVDIGALSDDGTAPLVDAFDIPANQVDVPDDARPIITFNRPVRTIDGRLPIGAIDVRGPGGVIDGVWVVVSADGRKAQFFPRRPFPPGTIVSIVAADVHDFRGQLFPRFEVSFVTYEPARVAALPIPANDLDILQHLEHGVPQLYAIVAHDDGPQNDWEHGLVSIDMRNPRSPRVVGEVTTPGVDRAVRVVTHDPPLVVSIDGAGNAQRFGTVHAFDFGDPRHPAEIGRRVLNLSPEVIQQQIFFLDGVPNEGGVPESLAVLGTNTLYVANPPVLGIQGVTLTRMIPPRNEIEGAFAGGYRGVATLGTNVVAAGQGPYQNELIVLSADLSAVLSRLPLRLAVLGLLTVPAYPVDADGDGNLGQAEDADGDATTASDEALDLVLVLSDAPSVGVFQILANGELRSIGSLSLPAEIGRVQGAAVDAQHRRLYLAGGTAGLVIADFDNPLHPLSNGAAVLKTVPLPGIARKLRLLTDARGIRYAVVACDHSLEIVQLTPEEAGLTIYDANNSSVVEERFEESEGTFILANNDNDDASTDSAGRPIQDRDKPGRVDGENDLRRLDIAAPMGQGVLTVDIPSGAERARVWLSSEREGVVTFPQRYDLGAGERPPKTMWIEGVAPSAADRDVRITYHWDAPAESRLDPVDDAVTATIVELDFIPGHHGTNEAAENWFGDRKTTFLQTDVEDVEGLINHDVHAVSLGQAQFGAVRVRGLDPLSVNTLKVRTTDEGVVRGWAAPVVDETAASDLQVQSLGPRAVSAAEDVMVYIGEVRTGEGSTLAPAGVRDALRSDGIVPVHSTQAVLPVGAVQIAIEIASARGAIPPLVGGDAGVAVLEVIDAQAFAKPISAGVRGGALLDAYRAFDSAAGAQFTRMQGALADRWSRLILRLTLPALDPHTDFDFSLGTDPAGSESLLRSNHIGDTAFPFGMLSRTGFEGFSADESAPEQVTPDGPTLELHGVPVAQSGRRRSAAVAYTPPGSFPYRADDSEPRLTEALSIATQPSGETSVWGNRKVLLVRPPVMFVHGLMGDRNAFGAKFVNQFFPSFVSFFVDYGPDSVSGFDRIFSAVPREIGVELQRLRQGDHVERDVSRRFELGGGIGDVQHRRIAATKVDAVAHSMGGLALRWYTTDALGNIAPQPRRIRYPSSSSLVAVDTAGFPLVKTQRPDTCRYQRPADFNHGDLRKVVTTGSPQLGSPIADYVMHEVCGDSREFFVNPLTADTLFYWLGQIHFAPGGISQSPDLGTAIADLAMGSTALGLLQANTSDPVAVHAIAATDSGADAEYQLAVFGLRLGATLKRASDLGIARWVVGQLGLSSVLYPALFASTPTLERYCPGFGAPTSDLVVPQVSALYGTQHYTVVDPFDHLQVNQAPDVAEEISSGLFLDTPQGSRVSDFDREFPSGQPWPLNCE